MNKKALGKGLGALIPQGTLEKIEKTGGNEEIQLIPVEKIQQNTNQPRKNFNPEKIQELAQSIKENGLIQPIVLRKEGNHYRIVAGERRFRACCQLGHKEIPSIVREFDDKKMSQVALIENIQRQDLSPVEEAHAYKRLIEDYSLTQAEMAEILGKSRSAITNTLRLLELPEEIHQMLQAETLTMGHARALLPLSDKNRILHTAEEIQQRGLSVRQTEMLVKKLLKPQKQVEVIFKENVELTRVTEILQEIFSTKVNISGTEKNGKIEISYYSLEDLNRILDVISEK